MTFRQYTYMVMAGLLITCLACNEDEDQKDNAYKWHAFFGGGGSDLGEGITLDEAGNIYVAGYSLGPWVGPDDQEPLNAYLGYGNSVVLMKLDPNGEYIWHTFFAPDSQAWVNDIALDYLGNLYVTGVSVAWNGPEGQAPINQHADGTGSTDIFVLKVDPDGQYMWHTFHGSTTFELTNSIVVDSNGNPSVCGCAGGPWSGPDSQPPLDDFDGSDEDIFLLKLNTDGEYQWHAFYGGPNMEHGGQVAIDRDDNLYLSGLSESEWSGVNDNPPLNPHSPTKNLDITLVKIGPDGSYKWHTFFGTSKSDGSFPVAVGPEGSVYLGGYSGQSWPGPANQAPLHAHSETEVTPDMVIIKLGSEGAYQWHTFFASTHANSIVLSKSGNIYIAGLGEDNWIGPDGEKPLNKLNNGKDALVMQLNPDGTYGWHSFYGGEDMDEITFDVAKSVTVDDDDNLYVVGYSPNSWLGPEKSEPLSSIGNSDLPPEILDGDNDIWVMKLTGL